jgi:hypothetical protein
MPVTLDWGTNSGGTALLFGFLLAITAVLSIILLRKREDIDFKSLHQDEVGGAYSFSFMIAVWLLALFLCVVFEYTQILMAKTGTIYAGFAAARTGIVWEGALTRPELQEVCRRAAVRSITPFSRGLYGSEDADGSTTPQDLDNLIGAFSHTHPSPVTPSYLRKKFNYADQNLSLRIVDSPATSDRKNFTVEVEYDYPLMFPFLGVVLGTESEGVASRRLRTLVSLPSTAPQTPNQELGIDY